MHESYQSFADRVRLHPKDSLATHLHTLLQPVLPTSNQRAVFERMVEMHSPAGHDPGTSAFAEELVGHALVSITWRYFRFRSLGWHRPLPFDKFLNMQTR